MTPNRIHVLKDTVINQIAAGEVVERPVSIVRELIDNSADAGATEITITIADGGHSLIRVEDNGCGMSKDDAFLAFERHATSKIASIEDLGTLTTMGFRGEALASIAAVARVTLTTRERGEATATELKIAGGKIQGVQSVAAPEGTTFEIRSLFFNTPARKKFLKSTRYEESKIRDWVAQVALTKPHIRYRLVADGKERFSAPVQSDFLSRARSLIKGSLIPISFTYDEVHLTGLIGHPSQALGDAHAFTILVNGRVVSDRTVMRAIKDGFSATLKEREFPIGCISITLPPALVDINVNPQKSEVRFFSTQKIYASVHAAVQDAIREFKTPLGAQQKIVHDIHPYSPPRYQGHIPTPSIHEVKEHSPRIMTKAVTSENSTQSHFFYPEPLQHAMRPEEGFLFSRLNFIGQLFECYLLCQRGDESFVIVDMHAAHERINFNRIRQRIKKREPISQKLLLPITIPISSLGIERILENEELLTDLGFRFDTTSDEILMHDVPSIFSESDVNAIIRDIASLPSETLSSAPIDERIDMIAARLACHASIRSGYSISREEVYALFELLDSADCSAACPHGRPCVVTIGEREVEQWFGRDR